VSLLARLESGKMGKWARGRGNGRAVKMTHIIAA